MCQITRKLDFLDLFWSTLNAVYKRTNAPYTHTLIRLPTILFRPAWPPGTSHGREAAGPGASHAGRILPQPQSRTTGQIWKTIADASISTIGQPQDDRGSVLSWCSGQCSY